jgi:3-methyladenine DNA glycosylase/8-oxoguanine DNA glycosylase
VPSTIDPEAAIKHLTGADPVIAGIIASVGAFEMRADDADPFRSLSRAIVYQQLSGKAAGTIFGRFLALFSAGEGHDAGMRRTDPAWSPLEATFPAPAQVLALEDETLRAVGLSRQKVASLRSLSEHFASGELGSEALEHWEDEEIITHLTRVRGIGRWTAEMFLMFHMRRADVLPVNDVGINRAVGRHYGLPGFATPDDIRRIGEAWRPHATVACWYLWRSEDVRLLTDATGGGPTPP